MRSTDTQPLATLAAPLVCFSNLDWSYLRYRKQHLMERLARHRPVVYVNPPRAMKWRAVRTWHRLTHPASNLWVYDPPVLPGIRRVRGLKAATDRLIVAGLRRLGLARPGVVWLYSPHGVAYPDLLSPDLVVYDMADDYTAPSGAHLRPGERRELRTLARLEREVLRRADLVLAVSEPLLTRARTFNPRAHLVPNGCDLDVYPTQPPAGGRRSRPRIGHVGTIAPRFDLGLVAEVAARRPDWDVELVGPVSPLVPLEEFSLPDNVTLAGEIPYAEVPARICRFDVCILPLREIDFATRSSPIQVYDYLAAGKPVVSTPIGQFHAVPDLVTTARGPEAFVTAVERALADRSVEAWRRRRRFAERNSWDARVCQILDLLDRRADPAWPRQEVA